MLKYLLNHPKMLHKAFLILTVSFCFFQSFGQFYTGYYVSAPRVHDFDHFKIKQSHGVTKLDGDLTIHAYLDHDEIWVERAVSVEDQNERAELIESYGEGKEIISTHVLKFQWDGNEWEYILFGYLGNEKHRHFVVIEEIFNDATETELLEFNTFDWVKGHHLETAKK